jgi:hypothetical protein
VFAESSESRAAMMTMMMTTERGGPAPSVPAALQLGGHAGAPACPPPAPTRQTRSGSHTSNELPRAINPITAQSWRSSPGSSRRTGLSALARWGITGSHRLVRVPLQVGHRAPPRIPESGDIARKNSLTVV